MIKLHHLRYSRSTRVLWLLEELGLAYELEIYERDPKTLRATEALRAAHPLGRAPVLEDGAVTIAESGAIVEYLAGVYGDGALARTPGAGDWAAYIEWLHYAEGSAMLGLIMALTGGREGLPPRPQAYATQSIEAALSHIARGLAGRDFLLGSFSAADIQISYVIDFAVNLGLLGDRQVLRDYLARLAARPAFQRALEIGGPMGLPLHQARPA